MIVRVRSVHYHTPWLSSCSIVCVRSIPCAPCGSSGSFGHTLGVVGRVRFIRVRPWVRSCAFGPFPCALVFVRRSITVRPGDCQVGSCLFGPFPCALGCSWVVVCVRSIPRRCFWCFFGPFTCGLGVIGCISFCPGVLGVVQLCLVHSRAPLVSLGPFPYGMGVIWVVFGAFGCSSLSSCALWGALVCVRSIPVRPRGRRFR